MSHRTGSSDSQSARRCSPQNSPRYSPTAPAAPASTSTRLTLLRRNATKLRTSASVSFFLGFMNRLLLR